MDYDDNDFQSQNLHLAGEGQGSTKFPPVLRPYALPKFDFDESLQGRFDSLVDTEVFLGIENNEDNQWIDAYSRGSSGIEFNSAAAETCSISRHNNVWSEATSSESVEMLLKSVGQEEFIPTRETVIQESDACDELACLANQMDPNPKPDEKIEFKDNVIDTQPPSCIHENLSGSKEDVEMEQSLAGISLGCEGESSIDGSLNNMKPPDMHRHIDLPDSGGNLSTDCKYDDTNQREVETPADGSVDEKTSDNSSASVVLTNMNENSTEYIPSTYEVLKIQNVQNQIDGMGDDDQCSLQTQTSKQDLESSANNKDSNVDTQTVDVNAVGGEANDSDYTLCLTPMEEALEGESVVEGLATGISTSEKPLNTVSNSISNSEDASFRNLSQGNANIDALLIKDPVVDDQSVTNSSSVPKITLQDDSSSEKEDACFRDSPQSNANDDALSIKGPLTDGRSALNTSDVPKIAIKDDSSSEGHKVEVSNSDCGICPNYQLNTTRKTFGETSVSKEKELLNIGNRSEEAPFNSSTIHRDDDDQSNLVDSGVCSSSLVAGSMETKLSTSTASVDVMLVNSSDHLELKRMKHVGSASVDEKEDFEAKIAEEAGISLPVGSSKLKVDPSPVSGTENKKNSDNTRQILCETDNNFLHNLVITTTEKIGEPQETQSDKVEHGCTKEAGVTGVLCESIEKQGSEVIVSFIKDDKEAIQEHHDKPYSKLPGSISSSFPDSHTELHETGGCPANPSYSNCGPSDTFGSPLETEKGENKVKPTANLNPPVFEVMNKDATNTSSSDHDRKGNDVSRDGRSLAPEVDLVAKSSKKDVTDLTPVSANAGERGPFPVIAANKESVVVAESPLASKSGTPKPNVAGHVPHGSPQIPDGALARSVSKGTPERKPRRAPNKTGGKESSRKGNKGKTPAKRSEKGDRSATVSLSPSSGFQLMQSNEAHQYGQIDSTSTKPFPDLNTSASPSVLFQQPFMDVQQVQLRAQIFVYGALIQGIVPEEAHMVSAFSGSDGGRNIWEKSWSSCLGRQHGHKSHSVNPETPLQHHSGTRTPDLALKQSEIQGKGISSPHGLASGKGTPTILNSFIPLTSPLWSLPTPSCDSLQSSTLARGSALDYSQAFPSLHPYQTPLRNFLGHNTSRTSQAPWVASSIPALDNSSYLSASPVTDTIKSSSIKGTSIPSSSSINNVPPGLPVSNVGLQSVFLAPTLYNTNNATVSHAQHSSDPKSKKRKKVTTESEDLGQKKAMHLQSNLVSTPVVSSHIFTSVATATPFGNVPASTVEKPVESVSPLSLADRLKSGLNVEKRIMSDESLTKIEEARINAEEASALSAAAVNHSMEIWKQLEKQKNSGLVSDIEAKLASAAVAVAAAAAVAKAAAAAARVASNAALQAKLMADEALIFSGHQSSCQIYLSEGISNLGKATPASILKGATGTNSSSSIIGAAKEASRRRVEAASFARKRAENMDAILKAAELAAEAVSQAGKIVTMGDPLPLSDLVEAGPEGRWKTFQEASQQVGSLRGIVGDRPETSQISNRDISSEGKQIAASEESPFHKVHNGISLDHVRSIDDISSIISINENSSIGSRGRSRGRKVSNLVNLIDVLPESGTEIQDGHGPENLEENNIKEGSHVEVFKDGKGFKAAWFTATILSLKEGKAYVYYNMLVADEGAGTLKEWVSLEGEGDKPPRIRAARPLTSFHNEGTRKRPRAAMVDYWSIGDRVDAWVQESWQEGIVTDKKKKDKTFTVHFPASGETSVVGAWHLRPSLIWNDGKWIESPKVGANYSTTNEGDTPHEKRPKLGSPAREPVKGKENTSKGTDAAESANHIESRLLNLTEDDKVFNVGKSKNEKKPDAHRLVRSGFQKERSGVVFGVPKPGKKTKFVEVSKHYVAGATSMTNDGNDSVKVANSLIPHSSGTRGWKHSSIKDTKEKPGADFKSTSKSGRPQNVSGRTIPSKQMPLSNSRTNDLASHTERTKDSSNHSNNTSQSENQVERASYSETAGAGPTLYSSRASSTDSQPSKKPPTSRVSKGKLAPAGGRLGKVEVKKALNPVKSTSEEVLEPRRSIRRIQPTSRLLEGIQSSLIISKIPSGSHEKGHKNQNRNTSKGNNHG